MKPVMRRSEMTTAKAAQTHIALKVLKSINEGHEPDAVDVEILRSLYPDFPTPLPLTWRAGQS